MLLKHSIPIIVIMKAVAQVLIFFCYYVWAQVIQQIVYSSKNLMSLSENLRKLIPVFQINEDSNIFIKLKLIADSYVKTGKAIKNIYDKSNEKYFCTKETSR